MKTDDWIEAYENIALQEELSENFGPAYANRGIRLWREGRVKLEELIIDGERLLASASVQGSRQEPYHTTATLILTPAGIQMGGECSCPVGWDCKHVAALCMEAFTVTIGSLLNQEDEEDEGFAPPPSATIRRENRRITAWLSRLDASLHKDEPLEEGDYRLHYILSQGHRSLQIHLFKVKPLKRGGFSKGSILSLYDLLSGDVHRYHFLTPLDLEALQFLKACMNGSYWNPSIDLQSPAASLALRTMLETGRVFFQQGEERHPLQWNDCPLSLDWAWKQGKDGRFRLKPSLNLSRLMGGRPLIYFDRARNRCHPVESLFDLDTIQVLADLPPVDAEELEEVARRLVEAFPSLPLPLPDSLEGFERIREKPRPVIGWTEKGPRPLFDYGGVRLPPEPGSPLTRRIVEDRIVEIERDPESEREALERMEEILASLAPEAGKQEDPVESIRRFLEEELPRLEEEGWEIEAGEPPVRFSHAEEITAETEEEGMGWFELSYEVELDGQRVSLVEPIAALLHRYDSPEELPERINLPLEEGHYLHLRAETILPIVRTLYQLFDRIEEDRIRIAPYDAHLLEGFEDNHLVWKGAEALAELRNRLREFRGITPLEPAPTLQAELRNYQRFGLSWLGFLHDFGFGGILADDMGLGKTLQTLAFLQRLKADGKLERPALVVVPTSLLGNWRLEATRFTPDLHLETLYGSERHSLYEKLQEADLVLTTYTIAQRDAEALEGMEFAAIILDEAQKIKNPRAKVTQLLKRLEAPFRLALTGTPMENHLGELWSIFDFVMPGFLGTYAFFKETYQTPIEKERSLTMRERLRKKIAPFMLRRSKEEVLDELPEKIELIRSVSFGKKQAALYETVRLTMEKKVRDEIAAKGIARSQIVVLDALLKLRQVCCDPRLLKIPEARKVKESAKLALLMELLDELIPQGHKILLFSQFTQMLDLLARELDRRKIPYAKLTGRTRKRDEVIERFRNDHDCPLFLISLKAGGVGLNLTEADTVIHYDPWWNPAVENQATDRAHRIGQTRRVNVYKLIVEGSIEEKILELQEKKAKLQRGIYSRDEEEEKRFDAEELLALLSDGK